MPEVTVGMAVKLAAKEKPMAYWGSLRIELDTGAWSTVYLSADEARLLASELEALADQLDPPKAAE